MSRNSPKRLRNGVVAQAGVDLHPRGARSIMSPGRPPYRAIVVGSRATDDPDNVRGVSVECDVILIATNITWQNVPVLQTQHGVNNAHAPWIPRRTTRVIGDDGVPLRLNAQISRRGSFNGPPTSLSEIDGDMVLVDFIEGNQDFPIIIGCLPHERTNRRVKGGAGWREGASDTRGEMREDEFYVHHYGTEIRVNEQGDLLIDTVGAYSDTSTEDASSGSIGQVRLRVKEGQRFTVAMGDDEDVLEIFKDGGQLRIDLGEGATERLVLGDAFKTYLDSEVQAKVNAFWLAYNVHGHPDPITGPSGPPVVPQTDTIAPMPDASLSDLAKTKKS